MVPRHAQRGSAHWSMSELNRVATIPPVSRLLDISLLCEGGGAVYQCPMFVWGPLCDLGVRNAGELGAR